MIYKESGKEYNHFYCYFGNKIGLALIGVDKDIEEEELGIFEDCQLQVYDGLAAEIFKLKDLQDRLHWYSPHSPGKGRSGVASRLRHFFKIKYFLMRPPGRGGTCFFFGGRVRLWRVRRNERPAPLSGELAGRLVPIPSHNPHGAAGGGALRSSSGGSR